MSDAAWRPRDWRAVLRFAAGHHPLCDVFSQDVVVGRAGSRRVPLCAGCLVFWPIFAAASMGLVVVGTLLGLTWWSLVAAGFAVSAVQALSYAGRAKTRTAKALVKGSLGLGAGAVAAGVLLAPLPIWASVIVLAALGLIAGAIQTLRLRKIFATCTACPWRRDWQFCPGFAPLNDHTPGTAPRHWRGPPAGLPRTWPWP